MIKVSAEARCPITYYEGIKMKSIKSLTKREIIARLSDYGIDATLRARKSTLVALLEEKKEEKKVDNVHWMEFTKVEPKDEFSMLPGFLLFLFGALIVYLWEDGVSFAEMAATAWVLFTLIGIPAIVYRWARA